MLQALLFLIPAADVESVRSVLSSDQPGSVQRPIALSDPGAVAAVCSLVSRRSPVDPEDDLAEADQKQEAFEAERKVTFAKVYRATVDPKNVRFDPYDAEAGALPVATERALPALDGALLLTVMDRQGAAFEVKVDEAKRLVEQASQKQLRLAVTFQVDDHLADQVSPCFSYPKSESASLRVRPLRYALLDSGGQELAAVSTPRMEALDEWLEHKGAKTELSSHVVNGVVNQAALDRAIEGKRSAVDACLERAGDAPSFGLLAAVAGGKLADVKVEMEASDDPDAAACLARTLAGTAAPRASGGASVSVVVSRE